jgi:hypothetical protein
VTERLAIGTESWVAAFSVRVTIVLALRAHHDRAGKAFGSTTEANLVADDIAELAVVVIFTADGATVRSLVAVTVLMLRSTLLLLVLALLLALVLVLVLVIVTVLGLLVVVVAFAVPEVVRVCAFEVCVLSFVVHVASVACFCLRLVHKVLIATVVVVVVVAFLATAILVLRGIVVVLVVVTTLATTFVGLVAYLATVVALDLAFATVWLIDIHVVGHGSGHSWGFYKLFGVDVVEIEGLVHRHETIFLFFFFFLLLK